MKLVPDKTGICQEYTSICHERTSRCVLLEMAKKFLVQIQHLPAIHLNHMPGMHPFASKRPTFGDYLRELGRLIQQEHGPTCVAAAQKLQADEKDAADASTKRSHDDRAASLNASQVLMLHSRLKITQARAAQVNKAALEAEKPRDELHTQIEEIEEQLQPKKGRSDADVGAGDRRTAATQESTQ